ncbi:hypothetical protein DCC81_09925 [Chitinophaga parva]|uniref:Uncharacterized protein n=1 Tax=Chitinophaga parva TaxID=2169414 RepID=A0A2T7BPY1_9BACT|nr:hypothetical protein [Chitinophaga parva]PUZ29734.1 hypothetical protein DCC81_09925 [Chitinophaga parva]
MKIERYPIHVEFNGAQYDLPVEIRTEGIAYRIAVVLNGTEVFYLRDHQGRMIAMYHTSQCDPALLYLIGQAIREQRPVPA